MTDYETVTLDSSVPHVLTVMMDRPQARNAMNTRMGLDLMHVFERFQTNPGDLRCLILTGRGDKAFCAGGAIHLLAGSDHAISDFDDHIDALFAFLNLLRPGQALPGMASGAG